MALQMPTVSQVDLDQVAAMILRLHAPETAGSPELAQALQKEVLDVFESDHAWGLTEGLLQHPHQVVRFSGAQNGHIKISRQWESLPLELQPVLLQQMLNLTSQAASPDSPYRTENSIVLRKLFSSLASLILRLAPKQWPNPLLVVVTTLAGHRVEKALIFEWLEIAIRDVQRGALLEPRKSELSAAISKEIPLVLSTVVETLTGAGNNSREVEAAFKCLEAYIEWGLRGEEITELLPTLLHLLNTPYMSQTIGVLVEILMTSVFMDGKATKITTEPLLDWFAGRGGAFVKEAVANEDSDSPEINSITKLVDALVDHSSSWMAQRMIEPRVQAFFGVMLDLTGFPGVPGRDENVSETTLSLYSTIQECITDLQEEDPLVEESLAIAKHFFREVTVRIRNKVRWPTETLDPEDLASFEVYRRDAGEVMITAFYVMREEILQDLLQSLVSQLKDDSTTSWQEVEATLHCIRFTSEAVPLGEAAVLPMIFSPDVFSRLPAGQNHRIQLATIRMIRSYEEWFKYHSEHVVLVLEYLVTSLDDQALASEAAIALKSLCDLCRGNLTAHVASFGQLHSKVASMGPEEQVRVTEAIASVLQAIPPAEAMQPILTITQPVLRRLEQCINAATQAPEAARNIAIQQLETLTACANGLTPSDEDMFDLDPEETATTVRSLETSRSEPELVKLREGILQAVSRIIEIWGHDIEIASAINAFMKASTASPSTLTLLSLPIAPLLYLIATAAQRNYLSIWPNTAATLIWRMAPVAGIRHKLAAHLHGPSDTKEGEEERERAAKDELDETVAGSLAALTWSTAGKLTDAASMQNNPDIAESFFKFGSAVITKFPAAFLKTSTDNQAACMNMAVLALSATEQFTLRGAIEFLVSMLNTSRHAPQVLAEAYLPIIQAHGQSVIFACVLGASLLSPRSTIPNYAELLVAFVNRVPNETRDWLTGILREPTYPGGKETPLAKKKFQDSMMRARTPKRIREALNDFALVCRGLAGTVYGSAIAI